MAQDIQKDAEVLPVQPEQELVEIPQENAPVDQQHTAEDRKYILNGSDVLRKDTSLARVELVNKKGRM